jgi:hypothetical protein
VNPTSSFPRIVWRCKKADQLGGNFIVGVMNAERAPLDVAAINTQDDGGATTYEYQVVARSTSNSQTYSDQ